MPRGVYRRKKGLIRKSLQDLGKPVPSRVSLGMPKKARSPTIKRTFKDAKRTLEERRASPPRGNLKDWNESWNDYYKRVRLEAREALLNECVPERKCPLCGGLRLRSAQWCVIGLKQIEAFRDAPGFLETMEAYLGRVVCRSCVKKLHYAAGHKTGRRKEDTK